MELEVVYLSPQALTPYEGNTRKHSPEDIEQIKESILADGFLDPIGIWGEKNIIVEGHGRQIAAMELGLESVPCIRLDHLTDTQRRDYAIRHNRTAELSGWDFGKLEEEIAALEIEGVDLSGLKFDLDSIGGVATDTTAATEDDYDTDAEVETRVKLGDIWQLGRHRLMCGDSTDATAVDRLMDGVKADMVFTDPPYGMNLDTDYSKLPENKEFQKLKGIKRGKSYKSVIGDNEDFQPDLISTIFNNFGYVKEMFIWGGDYFPELLQGYKDGNFIVWDKKSNEGMENHNFDRTLSSNFELCWSKSKHKKDIVRVLWVSAFGTEQEFDHKRYHPTQKPIKLARWFLEKYCKDGDNVVDLFGGSGSTLIACEQLNRTCYMMELDPHYCDVIIKRWENLTGEKAVLLNGAA